jgi:hypothetical protein
VVQKISIVKEHCCFSWLVPQIRSESCSLLQGFEVIRHKLPLFETSGYIYRAYYLILLSLLLPPLYFLLTLRLWLKNMKENRGIHYIGFTHVALKNMEFLDCLHSVRYWPPEGNAKAKKLCNGGSFPVATRASRVSAGNGMLTRNMKASSSGSHLASRGTQLQPPPLRARARDVEEQTERERSDWSERSWHRAAAAAHTRDPTSLWSSTTRSCYPYVVDLRPPRYDLDEEEHALELAGSRCEGQGGVRSQVTCGVEARMT